MMNIIAARLLPGDHKKRNCRACDSGDSFTARATAKIGELMLQKGHWHGMTIFSEDLYDIVMTLKVLHKPYLLVSEYHGWILKINRKWFALPSDGISDPMSGFGSWWEIENK